MFFFSQRKRTKKRRSFFLKEKGTEKELLRETAFRFIQEKNLRYSERFQNTGGFIIYAGSKTQRGETKFRAKLFLPTFSLEKK